MKLSPEMYSEIGKMFLHHFNELMKNKEFKQSLHECVDNISEVIALSVSPIKNLLSWAEENNFHQIDEYLKRGFTQEQVVSLKIHQQESLSKIIKDIMPNVKIEKV